MNPVMSRIKIALSVVAAALVVVGCNGVVADSQAHVHPQRSDAADARLLGEGADRVELPHALGLDAATNDYLAVLTRFERRVNLDKMDPSAADRTDEMEQHRIDTGLRFVF